MIQPLRDRVNQCHGAGLHDTVCVWISSSRNVEEKSVIKKFYLSFWVLISLSKMSKTREVQPVQRHRGILSLILSGYFSQLHSCLKMSGAKGSFFSLCHQRHSRFLCDFLGCTCVHTCVKFMVGRVISKWAPLCSCVVIGANEACNGGVWANDLLIINILFHRPVFMCTGALSVACKVWIMVKQFLVNLLTRDVQIKAAWEKLECWFFFFEILFLILNFWLFPSILTIVLEFLFISGSQLWTQTEVWLFFLRIVSLLSLRIYIFFLRILTTSVS